MKKVLFLVALSLAVYGCSVEDKMDVNLDEINLATYDGDVECGETVVWPFGTMDHGYVEAKLVEIDMIDYLSVHIIPGDGKTYNQARVEVATEVEYFPTKGGGLPPGQIQERDHFDNDPFLFPLSLFGNDCEIFIAAWAVITPGGSDADHWAGNLEFVEGNPNRGLYFEYCFDCEYEEPEDICESAYMFGSLKLNEQYGQRPTGNNWGWAEEFELSGDVNDVQVRYIWAGAGQNDTLKGTKVGKVKIYGKGTYDIIAFAPYSFSDIHVYQNDELPASRIPPGHFESASGDFDDYLVMMVHLEACWEDD